MPTRNPAFSAAQNFFDDFVAVHLNQTNFIHQTANFLTWHRYFVWVWEDTLRTECGYKGVLPVSCLCSPHGLSRPSLLKPRPLTPDAVLELVQVPRGFVAISRL